MLNPLNSHVLACRPHCNCEYSGFAEEAATLSALFLRCGGLSASSSRSSKCGGKLARRRWEGGSDGVPELEAVESVVMLESAVKDRVGAGFDGADAASAAVGVGG